MVNTFLTHINFAISATALDVKRLNAQCNESLIIINILRWVDRVVRHFQLEYPVLMDVRNDKPKFSAWLKQLRDKYKQEGPLPEESELKTKFGYLFHPTIRMWLGHTALLEQYHRAHLVEWLSRGYKSTRVMPTEVDIDILTKPYWVCDEKWHRNFQLALLFKAPDHYSPRFVANDEVFPGYLW